MNSSKLLRLAGRVLAALLLLAVLLGAAAWWAVRQSLPQLDGSLRLAGLAAPLTISRDAQGTVVLQGQTRFDIARGLGFVHGQERFFEMDLTRRSAAGELSALFGKLALERDRTRRVHRMRARLAERFAQLAPADRAVLQAYADGVNTGLAQMPVRPWQYLLLRAEPEPWTPVDSLLVTAEMFWMLQASSVDNGFDRAWLRERVGDRLYAWLEPQGGRWDAALDDSRVDTAPMPGPELLDLRRPASAPAAASAPRAAAALPVGRGALGLATQRADRPEPPDIGSNNWAVAGSRTAHGGALLADDMHLGLSAPSIWFRAQIEIADGPEAQRVAGVTLPGLPAIVVGSNGHVAWGFTNAYGQWFDWIELPANAAAPRLRTVTETIRVKGGEPVTLAVREFDGSPVAMERDGRAWALRWIAHQGDAYNLALDGLRTAADVDAALAIAQRAGMPHQNFVVADSAGHIAWTIAGRLWADTGMSERHARFQAPGLPQPGWLAPEDYPVVKDPSDGQLWTANNRQLGGAGGALIGDGGFDLGARAKQIRARLAAMPRHDEASLAAIHLDDEARFMQVWARRLAASLATSPAHAEVVRLVQGWNGRADAGQAAYRLVRAVRLKTLDQLWAAWTTPLLGAMQADDKRRLPWHAMFEYSAAQALDERPAHLLPPAFASWDALVLAQVDAVVDEMTQDGRRPLAQATWGERNTSHVQHVLSRAVPALAVLLDMPALPQSGDGNLPHVAGPAFGQSERLVVAPGREAQGTLVMPGGQSGHPLSPFYGAGHADWAAGRTGPLLAGPPMHRLAATP